MHSWPQQCRTRRWLGRATLVGPILIGLEHSVQIARIGATATEVLNMAAIAGYGLEKI